MKVLVVDDDPIMRRLVVRLASRHPDVVIREAENGVDALAQVEAERPDLVFTDVTMPYLDGLGLLEALRASAACRDLPVVAVSAISDKSLVLRMVDLGIEGYLLKPLDPATAAERFDEILSRIAARNANPGPAGSARKTALVVDREPGYGVVVRAALGDRFEIVDHLPAAAAFAWAVTHQPALLLLGQGLPMPTEQVIARTARAAWGCKAILIANQPTSDAGDDFDGVVTRSHVPSKLAQGLESILSDLTDDGGTLSEGLRAAVRAELVVAGRQSLGILTGHESTEVAVDVVPDDLVTAQVRLTREGTGDRVLLRLRASATDLAALHPSDTDASPDALLRALGTPAAARVAHALAGHGWRMTTGAPEAWTGAGREEAFAQVALESEGGHRIFLTLATEQLDDADAVSPVA